MFVPRFDILKHTYTHTSPCTGYENDISVWFYFVLLFSWWNWISCIFTCHWYFLSYGLPVHIFAYVLFYLASHWFLKDCFSLSFKILNTNPRPIIHVVNLSYAFSNCLSIQHFKGFCKEGCTGLYFPVDSFSFFLYLNFCLTHQSNFKYQPEWEEEKETLSTASQTTLLTSLFDLNSSISFLGHKPTPFLNFFPHLTSSNCL